MTRREFLRWQAFFQLHPADHNREDLHFADLMSLIANIASSKKKQFKTKDFLRDWSIKAHKQVSEPKISLKSKIEALGSAYGAIGIRRR